MIVYLVCFAISILLIYLSQKICDRNKALSSFLTFIGLIIPCLLAGLRKEIIGTDVRVYVKPMFECAKRASTLSEYFSSGWSIIYRIKWVKEFEYGFSFLVYITTKIFSSLNAVLFMIQALIIFPIYFGIKKFDRLKNIRWLCLLIYYLIFYGISLNIMRQMIGISIIFYATCCLITDKNSSIKFLILTLISILFHKSSALALIIFLIYKLVFNNNKLKILVGTRKLNVLRVLLFLILITSIFLTFNLNILLKILSFLGLEYYYGYLSNDISISYSQILLRIPIVLIFLFYLRKNKERNNLFYFFFSIIVLDLIFANLASASRHASRIGYIFELMYIIILPLTCINKDNKINKINTFFTLSYASFYWIFIYVIYKSSEIIPYIPFWN